MNKMKTNVLFLIYFLCGIQLINADNIVQPNAREFINKQPDKLFIGVILDSKSLNKDAYEIVDVPLNPVTISYSLPSVYSQSLQPSYENMYKSAREAIGESVNVGNSFLYTIQQLNSYEGLSWYFGQDVTPSSYFGTIWKQKDPKHSLIVVDIKQVFFRIDMDLPVNLYVDPQALEEYESDDLICVTSVGFGRKALIVIESSASADNVTAAATEAIKDYTKISDKSKTVLANSTIRLMLLGNQQDIESDTNNPFEIVDHFINKEVNQDDFGIPVIFGASYLKDWSLFCQSIRKVKF
ncbi:MAG: thiol-activated cytolysin family protein [Tannerellaceae bacterium]|nr:thiol-activated cytolysin family protein [Tannerellaceae bacterium]